MKQSILLIVFSMIISCSLRHIDGATTCDVIDLNGKMEIRNCKISNLIDTIKIIKLSTNENSLVDNIHNIIPTNGYIYIHDYFRGGGCIIFDNEGNFIKRLEYGQGPGELPRYQDICYDYNQKMLYATDGFKINKYREDGTFVQSYHINTYIQQFFVYNNAFFIIQMKGQNKYNKFSVLRVDSTFNSGNTFVIETDKIDRIISKNFTVDSYNDILITRPYDNIIYSYKNDILQSKYLLDFRDKELCIDDINTSDEIYELEKEKSDKYLFAGKILETNDYVVYSFYSNLEYCHLYVNKYNGLVFNTKAIDISSMDGYFKLLCPLCTYNNCFYSILHHGILPLIKQNIQLNETISRDDYDKIQNTQEDDNQLILLYKLKNNL